MSIALVVTMLLCFAFSISVAVSIGFAAWVGIAGFTELPWLAMPKEMFTAIDKFPLAAIPFFILAGNLMETGGISRRLVDFAKSLVGGVQGGLPMTCVLTCMIFAAVSGSSVATTFAIGAILIPALIRHGYPKQWAAALQACSAELGVIIPPSIPMILYGVAAEVSIGELFIAGFGPGLLIGGALMLFVFVYCRLKGWGRSDGEGRLPLTSAAIDVAALAGALAAFFVGNRLVGPLLVGGGTADAADRATDLVGLLFGVAYFIAMMSMPRIRAALLERATFALMMPVIILGGIYGGVFTPTEASVVAVFYALFVGIFVYREVGARDVWQALKKSTLSAAVIMFIIANAGLFAYLITRAGIPEQIGAFLKDTLKTPQLFLLGVNGALFVIGMFIETSASIIVLAPILAPVATHFGIDPVHFGIIMVVNLALGMITPPFGVNLFAACTVAKISLDEIVPRLLPFVLVVLGCLIVTTYAPPITLGLRDLVYR
ncbi:MAG TPA: TRAP transporter large permease [Burkholderiaceae bacterium]|nr:TRAP transporter large permease [Burkholderiaceae bacterium]